MLESAHGSEALLEMTVISLDAVVEVLRRLTLDREQDSAQGRRVAFGLIRRHTTGAHCARFNRALEERLGCSAVVPTAQVHIDDLPVLVNRPVEGVPVLHNLDIRFVHTATTTYPRTVCLRGCDEARCESPDPLVDRTWIDGDAALSQPRDHISIAEPKPEIPAHSQRDHLVQEAIAAER